jgi:hypothetical protein
VSTTVLERPRRGRPPCCPRELVIRIIQLHHSGLSYERIAARLNAEGASTPAGGSRWLKSSVDRLLHTKYVRELIDDIDAG